jgi:hypothetical protein
MSENPLNKRGLTRASIAGAALALGGIILFVVLWLLLSSLDQFPRLIIAVCVPPALIALVMGIYFLMIQPGNKHK